MDLNTISVIVTMVVSALGIVWYVQRRMDRMEAKLDSRTGQMEAKFDSRMDRMEAKFERANERLRAEFRGALDKVWLVLVDLRERVSRIEGHLGMGQSPPTSAESAEVPHRPLLEAPAELPPAAGDVEHHVSR